MEYSAAVWEPHLKRHKEELKNVQPRAAQFMKMAPAWTRISITTILTDLKWKSMEDRSRVIRLALSINRLTSNTTEDILMPAGSRTDEEHPQNPKNHYAFCTIQTLLLTPYFYPIE